MDYVTISIITTLVSLVLWLAYRSIQRPQGFPPGPMPIPFLGNVSLFMAKDGAHSALHRLTKKYGGILSVKVGPMWVVILGDIDMAKEALLKRAVEFAGRPNIYSVKLFTQGYKNIVFSPYSETWRLHRKVAHSAIRHFASGENLENLVYNMVPKMATVIDSYNGMPFDPKVTIRVGVYNILATMCFGHDYGFNDPKLKLWMDLYDEQAKEFSQGQLADIIPWLQGFKTPGFKKIMKFMKKFFGPFEEELAEHKKKFDSDSVADLIDCLLKEQQAAERDKEKIANSLTDTHIIQTLSDVFSAGSDTTVNTLRWSIAFMTEYPDIQTRVADEIHEIIGDRQPCLDDRGKMPYTEATMLEIFRCGSVVPLGVVHATTAETTVGGYRIPHGTWVFINHWGLHHDKKEWHEPHTFKPEHFLDDTEKVVQHPNSFLPFSAGRRVCLGESFAKAEIFLLFCWLLQHYTFTKAPGLEGLSLIKADLSQFAFHLPKPFEVVASPRHL